MKDAEDYINRKDYRSIVLQGFVDNNHMFRDVFMGLPGKSFDARIFENSSLYQDCLQRTFLYRILARRMQNTSIPLLIMRESAYPLEEFIMKPYTDREDLNPKARRYNVALSKTRVVVENAFGRLKDRFQCLSERDTSVQKPVNIVAACCTLHSVCELKNRNFSKIGYKTLIKTK